MCVCVCHACVCACANKRLCVCVGGMNVCVQVCMPLQPHMMRRRRGLNTPSETPSVGGGGWDECGGCGWGVMQEALKSLRRRCCGAGRAHAGQPVGGGDAVISGRHRYTRSRALRRELRAESRRRAAARWGASDGVDGAADDGGEECNAARRCRVRAVKS